MNQERLRARVFTVAITLISRALMFRDRFFRVTDGLQSPAGGERFFFASGGRQLAAVWVAEDDDRPALLICHGIGETVEHWSGVQAYLQKYGIGSMVFDYSGYGRSEGQVGAKACDEDLISAYREICRHAQPNTRIFVLGFSLGSGIAASGAPRLEPPPAGLFLCEAFPSFRRAALEMGVTRGIVGLLPDIWNTVDAVERSGLRTCVVHSDSDRLFPLAMGREIADACGDRADLVVVSGCAHNELYLRPTEAYWGPIVERMMRE
jgi:pimeloyl-ACP methyl ester carboxylesterase